MSKYNAVNQGYEGVTVASIDHQAAPSDTVLFWLIPTFDSPSQYYTGYDYVTTVDSPYTETTASSLLIIFSIRQLLVTTLADR